MKEEGNSNIRNFEEDFRNSNNPRLRQSASVSQVIDAPIEEHSKKPDIVKDKIVELMGDLPRIELFARQKTKGWEVWGNEVNGN